MERELFTFIRRTLRTLGKRRRSRRFTYTDAAIVEVYCWAVINDRPVVWATDPGHWPRGVRRGPLPSQSVVSRRLRSRPVQVLLQRLEERVLRRGRTPVLLYAIDGKPLPIAGHSADRQAGYGRAAGSKAKGYKLHALIDLSGTVWSWKVEPMNADERTVGQTLLPQIPAPGYLLADRNYDSNKLFAAAAQQGVQMVVARRYGPCHGTGHRRQQPSRMRSRDMLECDLTGFGPALLWQRKLIEYYFARLCSGAAALNGLPSWVRTHRRVNDWVRIKILICQIKADLRAKKKAIAA